jgi:very-short-patch-repair endonuclease
VAINNKDKKSLAAQMRRNPTPHEMLMWRELRNKPGNYSFWNQAVLLGYIADFYCPAGRFVIEIDGSSHKGRASYDAVRDQAFGANDIAVYRFSNDEVAKDLQAVVLKIVSYADARGARHAEDRFNRQRSERLNKTKKIKVQGAQKEALPEIEEETQSLPQRAYRLYGATRVPDKAPIGFFRCTWCLNSWGCPINVEKQCRKCLDSVVVKICAVCKVREIPDEYRSCGICADAAKVARDEVGKGTNAFGTGSHRARKV